MAWARVQTKVSAVISAASGTIAFTVSNITSGNVLVVKVTAGSSASIPTIAVTDSAGNTYTERATATNAGDVDRTSLFTAPITVGGGTKPTTTVTLTGATTPHFVVDMTEYSGVSNVPDKTKILSDGSAASASTGATAATTGANELGTAVIGDVGVYTSMTATGTLAALGTPVTNNSIADFASEEGDTGASGSTITATWTLSSAGGWSAVVVVLPLSGGAAAPAIVFNPPRKRVNLPAKTPRRRLSTVAGAQLNPPYPFVAQTQRRAQRGLPVVRARHPYTINLPQVNPPHPFTRQTQRRAQRGWIRVKGRSAETIRAQLNPPWPPPQVVRRALRGWLRIRPQTPGAPAPQVVGAPPPYPPPASTARRAVRGWLRIKGRATETVPPQFNPPSIPTTVLRRALRGVTHTHARSLDPPWPSQVVVVPSMPYSIIQRRALRGWRVTAARGLPLAPDQQPAPAPFRPRPRPVPQPRARGGWVIPPQDIVLSPPPHRSVRGWLLRRGSRSVFQFLLPLVTTYDGSVRVWMFFVPDEIALNQPTTLYAEYAAADGSRPALDAAPTARVFGTSAGTDNLLSGPTAMSGTGASSWAIAYTPTTNGPQALEVRGLVGGITNMATLSFTVRPQFDPIALATSDTLVSRM